MTDVIITTMRGGYTGLPHFSQLQRVGPTKGEMWHVGCTYVPRVGTRCPMALYARNFVLNSTNVLALVRLPE